MDFDKTRIAIRERSVLDTLDLSFHTIRVFLRPLLLTLGLLILPLMILNQWLIGDILDVSREDYTNDEWMGVLAWYYWQMSVLVMLEAPFASVLATIYLGKATFFERPSMRQVFREAVSSWPAIVWCLLLLRGPVPAIVILMLSRDRVEFDPWLDFYAFGTVALVAIFLRGTRPFVAEIILLERKPLGRRGSKEMSVGQRSTALHTMNSSELFSRWIAAAATGVAMVVALYQLFLFVQGVVRNSWEAGPLLLEGLVPLAMWIVAGFMTVFRFLSYLDIRIRNEGWEVELLLRAEAARLASSLPD